MELSELKAEIEKRLALANITEPKEDDILKALGEIDSEHKISDEFLGDDDKLGAWIDSVLEAFAPKK